MTIMNQLKTGGDITKPKASVGYVVVLVMFMALVGVAAWVYGKMKKTVSSGVSNMTSGLESQSAKQLEGFL